MNDLSIKYYLTLIRQCGNAVKSNFPIITQAVSLPEGAGQCSGVEEVLQRRHQDR